MEMKLRRPLDKLAGCVWLPRLIDKTRHHFAGTLDAEYVRPFCHPLATDGVFFEHFQIEKDEFLTVVAESKGDNQYVAAWFTNRPACSPERIESWNTLAPNLGKENYPVRKGFLWVLKHYFGGVAPDPRVDSAFTAIAYDEGFLDEL